MKKENLSIRQTKTVSQCAVGALVQVGDHVVVPCDTRFWKNKDGHVIGSTIWGVQRLRLCLATDKEFRKAPVIRQVQTDVFTGDRIPAVRFPSWMRCPKCGRLYRLPWLNDFDSCQEQDCSGPKLVPIQWIMISRNGCMDDIPWRFIIHRDQKKHEQINCADDKLLRVFMDKKTLRWQAKCDTCKSYTRLAGLSSPDFLSTVVHVNEQPWIKTSVKIGPQPRNGNNPFTPIAVELTDHRIHLTDVINAIDIPPESRIDLTDLHGQLIQDEGIEDLIRKWKTGLIFPGRLRKLANEKYKCPVKALKDAIEDIATGKWPDCDLPAERPFSDEKLLQAEFDALCKEYPDIREWERFRTRHVTTEWISYLKKILLSPSAARVFNRLVIVERLREVQVLKGFRRVASDGVLIPPDLTGETNWLPACELFGEGIFFTLNETVLREWEADEKVQSRAEEMEKRRTESLHGDSGQRATPRFIMLHTLVHLIIRRMEFDCGYPAASIRERIYCQPPTEFKAGMAGALIFVAVPDKMGSLGGLCRTGEPARFMELLTYSFENARRCSLDPICIMHDGQGPDQLNRAACHACCLLPETSCGFSNCLLDRAFLIGDQKTGLCGFLDFAASWDGDNQ